MSEEFISNAESRGCRSQGDGKDPARLDTGAASWPLPKARAGYRDCGSHGSSSDRSPGSPRTSGDVPTWTHATGKLRTIVPPIAARAVAVHRCCCGYPRHSQGKEPCAKSRKRLLWRLITVIPLTARLNGFGRESAAMTPRLFRPRAGVG